VADDQKITNEPQPTAAVSANTSAAAAASWAEAAASTHLGHAVLGSRTQGGGETGKTCL